jgi:hypothetical protein
MRTSQLGLRSSASSCARTRFDPSARASRFSASEELG